MAGVYSVSQINAYIRRMFEQDFVLHGLSVRGEVSNCKYHTSGHLYFTMKDAGGAISCVMFASSRKRSDPVLREGMQIVAEGSIRVFERDGKYQLYVSSMTEEGAGELFRIFEKRKQEMEEMGLFSPEYKKPIPRYCRRVGIVTAKTGAAIHDIINISARRNPYVQLILAPAAVQGAQAAGSIAAGIRRLDALGVDCIIVGRGGGSIEDLWAFNEEEVARAIFDCETPVISAVGHETDFTIADFVADLRAPTPSAAAELAVFDHIRFEEELCSYYDRLDSRMERKMEQVKNRLSKLELKLKAMHPRERLAGNKKELEHCHELLSTCMRRKIEACRHILELRAGQLNAASPLRRMAQGYALVTDTEGISVKTVDKLPEGTRFFMHLKDGSVEAVSAKVDKRDDLCIING
ncbi:MAG: exodeoxyribonuclease VII large subunit [Parasporobacterium sp.]|nr:exodeoxyribonuclease VII large subunit [Parasporobacterium sp.]